MANDLSRVIALADLGEAVLAAVKESGLMRKRRRARAVGNSRRGKRRAKGQGSNDNPVLKAKTATPRKSTARKPSIMGQIPD